MLGNPTPAQRELSDSLDQVVWYARCLEDVQDRRPVRGLDEAKAGYDAGLRTLRAHIAALDAKDSSA